MVTGLNLICALAVIFGVAVNLVIIMRMKRYMAEFHRVHKEEVNLTTAMEEIVARYEQATNRRINGPFN